MTASSLTEYLTDATTSLPEQITAEDASAALLEMLQRNEGATFNLYFGDMSGEPLYAVSVFPERSVVEPGKAVKPGVLTQFIAEAQALLHDPRNNVGLWYDSDADVTYLDVSTTLPDREEVIILAMRYNQVAVYDLIGGVEIATGGTGEYLDSLPPAEERLPEWTREEWIMTSVDISQTTTRAEVVQIIPGKPPTIVTIHRAVNSRGTRHFTLKTPILDLPLFQRLAAQVQDGDEIEATIVNEWHDSGRVTYLADFSLVAPAGSVPAPRALAATP